ncbi:hypothetical protein K469DRAFT_710894 [Zopfia rhizophila CBS 207.26]|uniref:Uncharacterized protein n=1 Tax=Zopfia rhizophila CBS 207.26 TaxID=1314779 RepID=A0A6A6DYW3_9PEZI|nr:hypothetical protein K469DRAFT_710894 [Zopfia rhizophila CBS 207.26]
MQETQPQSHNTGFHWQGQHLVKDFDGMHVDDTALFDKFTDYGAYISAGENSMDASYLDNSPSFDSGSTTLVDSGDNDSTGGPSSLMSSDVSPTIAGDGSEWPSNSSTADLWFFEQARHMPAQTGIPSFQSPAQSFPNGAQAGAGDDPYNASSPVSMNGSFNALTLPMAGETASQSSRRR